MAYCSQSNLKQPSKCRKDGWWLNLLIDLWGWPLAELATESWSYHMETSHDYDKGHVY